MKMARLKARFCEIYGGDERDVRIFSAPGRVNLIGEHTDYNGGFVLPAAINMGSAVALRARGGGSIRLASTDLPNRVAADKAKLWDYRGLAWGNYQLGTAFMLARAGYEIVGCDMLFDESIPHGAGLSSSAAIELATATAFAALSNEARGIKKALDMTELAKLSQMAEAEFCGVNCGIMDQFASAMGKKGHAIYLNCRDLSFEYVPLNLEGYKIVIANTNKKRALGDSKYNERRSQCESALSALRGCAGGGDYLADISPERFLRCKGDINDEAIRRRAEHVIGENDRVKRAKAALVANDISGFGRLMNESHRSLRELYEVTGPELDALVGAAWEEGAIGSKMTGAGFGGCAVSIVRDESTAEFIDAVGRRYKKETGLFADFYICSAADGAGEIG